MRPYSRRYAAWLLPPPFSVFFVKEVVAGIKRHALRIFLSEFFAASEFVGDDSTQFFFLDFFLSSFIRSSTTLHTHLLLCCAQRSAFSFPHHQHNLGHSPLELVWKTENNWIWSVLWPPQTKWKILRQTDDRQRERQTDRDTDRHTHTHTHNCARHKLERLSIAKKKKKRKKKFASDLALTLGGR